MTSGATVSSTATLSLTVTATASRSSVDIYLGAAAGGLTVVSSDYMWGTNAGTYSPNISVTLPAAVIAALQNNQSIYVKFTVKNGNLRILEGATITLSGTYVITTTVCGAPTMTSLPATVAENDPTLTWSGATAGSNNAITGYEIQYCESSNGNSWGTWTDLKVVESTSTSGSTTVALSSTRGYYRKYRIRTQGSAGSSFYSAWKETASVRKNTIPNQATSVTASPVLYSTDDVTLSWSGVVVGASPIKAYMIGYKSSTDGGSTWNSTWTVITTNNSTATSGTRTFTISSLPGIFTVGNWYKFGVWTIDSLDVYSNQAESNTIQCAATTSCVAPTVVTLAPTIVETTLNLSWSGASGGLGNNITGYELQLSESIDNILWGEWQLFTFVTSSSTGGTYSGINPPATRGAYRRFRIQVRGSAGSEYYSDWAVSNSAQRNTLPTPPTTFTAAPASYYDVPIQLTWSGAVAGTSAIKSYIIQYSTSSDGNSWSGWSALTTVSSSTTSGTYTTTASNIEGTRTKYRIAVADVLDAVSGHVESNAVMKQLAPEIPIVISPTAGSTTYNTRPRFLLTTGGSPDGRTQRIAVKIDGGDWCDSQNNSAMFSKTGMLANGVPTIFMPPVLSIGAHTATIKCVNPSGSSAEVVRSFSIAVLPYTDVIQYQTVVTAAQMNALHNATNRVRAFYGFTSMRWVDTIVAGVTQIRDWPLHIAELRAGIEAVVSRVNGHDVAESFAIATPAWITPTGAFPQADMMNQIATVVKVI
jgi:hypothetical protein